MAYRFEDCSLAVERRELRRAGAIVRTEPQVLDLLLFLVRNRERMVDRDDLVAAIWQGRIISESTIASRIAAARRAIGDDGARQRLIRTHARRRGFRFVGEVWEDGITLQADGSPIGSRK
jgi:DNA-binding winged helix-turn-helix (wHTH) protein